MRHPAAGGADTSIIKRICLWKHIQKKTFLKGNATCGVLPYDAGVTTYGGDVNSGFAVMNVALKAMKDIKITNSFSLPIFTQAIWNPRMEDAHLVLGISLRP